MSFTLLDTKENEYTNSKLFVYKHRRTGCEVLHAYNNDKENAFMFAVPTHPTDSSGVSHILEHCVLSGSERYNVKSPFFRLIQGSCKTYLNASTYPDRTLYMGASTIKKDVFNLLSVYGDAVLFPLLKEEVFRREGFRFHPANTHQEHGEMIASGIVYNEMKGEYSDKLSILMEALHEHLFPDMFYRFDSGGNPSAIPLLTYEQFLAFHKKWYRPEFIKILLYGNIPTEEYLDFIDANVLCQWTEETQHEYVSVPLQPHKHLGHRHIVQVPASDVTAGEQGIVDISWLVGETKDVMLSRSLAFLHLVTVGMTGSPLRKALIESGLADDISMLTGPSGYLNQLTYTLGMTGFKTEQSEEIEQAIIFHLSKVIDNGISADFIQSALSRTEFRLKEALVNTSGKMSWLSRIARGWLSGEDVFECADVLRSFTMLKEHIKIPRYLENFARTYLLDNTHRVITCAQPDHTYDERMRAQEHKMLHDIWIGLSTEAKEHARVVAHAVERLNSEPDNPKHVQSIPLLTVDELPEKVEVWNELHENSGHIPVQWIENTHNDLLYIWYHFDITDLMSDANMRYSIPTFSAAFTDIGTINLSYDALATKIRRITGKMGMIMHNYTTLDGKVKIQLSIYASIVNDNIEKYHALLLDLFVNVNYRNTARLKEIVTEGKTMLRHQMSDSGTTFAAMKAVSNFMVGARVDDDWNGPEQLRWIQTVSDYSDLSELLMNMRTHIFNRTRMSCSIVVSQTQRQSIMKHITSFGNHINTETIHLSNSVSLSSVPIKRKQAFFLPVQVAFNAMAVPSIPYTDTRYASCEITMKLASNKLIENIRMEQGAYGAGAYCLGAEGIAVFYTYRDPNIGKSLDIFKQSLIAIAQGDFTDSDLESLIISTTGDALQIVSPAQKGNIAQARHITGITNELRQQIRESLRLVERKQVMDLATLCLDNVQEACFASICSKSVAELEQWDYTEQLSD